MIGEDDVSSLACHARNNKSIPDDSAIQNAERVEVFKCPSCAGVLSYSPIEGQFACASCGSLYPVDRIIPKTVRQLHGFTCPECGAELISDDEFASFPCPYCGNNEVAASKFDGSFEPDFIIPFAFSLESAKRRFVAFAKSRDYIPNDFLKRARFVSVEGTYVPFWLFNGRADFDITYYYKNKDEGEHHRVGSIEYMRIPADASERMPNDMMDSLQPYDYSALEPFTTDFMPGFVAERYTEHYDEARGRITKQTTEGIVDLLRPQTASSEDASHDVKFVEPKSGPEQALLPVWMFVIEYKGKRYLAGVNGQSGKAAMNFPIDTARSFTDSIKSGMGRSAIVAIPALVLFIACMLMVARDLSAHRYSPLFSGELLAAIVTLGAIAAVGLFIFGFNNKEDYVVQSTQTVHSFESAENHLAIRTLKYTVNESKDYFSLYVDQMQGEETQTGSFGVAFGLPNHCFNACLQPANPHTITWAELRDFVAAHSDCDTELVIQVQDRMGMDIAPLSIGMGRQGYLASTDPGPIRIGFINSANSCSKTNKTPTGDRNAKTPITGGELIDFLSRCANELDPDDEARWIWDNPDGSGKYYYTGRYYFSSDAHFEIKAFAKQGIFLISGCILEQD